jgi:mycoredoxin
MLRTLRLLLPPVRSRSKGTQMRENIAMSEKVITMYWRPGCGFCSALERQLVRNDLTFEKRNIWDDPTAAEFVRSVARGNETVPTLTIGDTSMVNPSIDEVLAALVE